MSQSVRGFERTFLAENDLSSSQFFCMKLGTNANEIDTAGAGERVVGILQNTPESGQGATVRFLGTSKAKAGGSITKGNYVKSDGNGKIVSSSSDQDDVVGIALEAADNNDIIEVMLTPGVERSTA